MSEKFSALNGINASLSTSRLGDTHGRGMWKDSSGLEVREDWSEQCLLDVTGPLHSRELIAAVVTLTGSSQLAFQPCGADQEP